MHLPISLVVPAYNESRSIVTSIKALLQLEYPDFEVVVVNDGSTDDTLEKLIAGFQLYPYPEAYRKQVPCRKVRTTYRSARYRNLRVVDKENGGSKADAANAGINICRNPLVAIVDADGVLQRDSLRRAVRPFLENPETVAAGGAIRIANGCTLRDGFLEEVALPRNPLALMQVIEYLRSFLFGRMGWEPLGAVLIVSGAFGVFRRTTLIEVGGFNPQAVGEDMELIVRIHRIMKQQRRRYHIGFIPDPVCWTDAPESLKDLGSQRTRWHHGLGQALMLNRWLILNPRGGTVSWLAIPFYVLFELLGPVIEALGLVLFVAGGGIRAHRLARRDGVPAARAVSRHAAVDLRDHARGVLLPGVPQAARARAALRGRAARELRLSPADRLVAPQGLLPVDYRPAPHVGDDHAQCQRR